jgi:hypothetical protein
VYYTVQEPSAQETYYYWSEPTESYVQYNPTPVEWTSWYSAPSVPLYWYEPSTETYEPVSEPSPYLSYYWYEPSTQTYFEYSPSPLAWTSTFEEPSVPLYYYDESTSSYYAESEPSPAVSYYFWEPSTESYIPYEATPVQWTSWYEEPTV